MGYPKMDGFIWEDSTERDDSGVPLFQETSIYASIRIFIESMYT